MNINKNSLFKRGRCGFLLLLCLLAFSTCKDPEGLYKEYLVPNGLKYPAKVLDAETHPGYKRIEIAWRNGVNPSVRKARIFWNNYTDSTELAIDAGVDFVVKELNPMAENTYSFMIRTYDAEGNVSVPVEVIGEVYGDAYQNSLVNRVMKSAVYDADEVSVQLEWYGAVDKTEMGVELSYTGLDNVTQNLLIDPSETATFLSDFKISEPIVYRTVFKPDTMSIDLFYASAVEKRIPYWAEISAQTLKNYTKPFTYHGSPAYAGDYFKGLDDWTVNAAAEANGNALADGRFCMCVAGSAFPSPSIVNGKVFQTVELEAGTYRFDVVVNYTVGNPVVYLVAVSGDDFPDANDVEQEALEFGFCPQQTTVPQEPATGSVEFVITAKSRVSLGLSVPNFTGTQMIFIDSFALWMQK